MKIFKKVLETVFTILISLIAIKSIWNFVDVKTGYRFPFFGLRECVVVSNSMSFVNTVNEERLKGVTNQFSKNDVVCINQFYTYESIQVNDIVTYLNGDGILIVHRVVSKVNLDGTDGFVIQGDANSTSDGFIPYSRINGRVYKIIPKFGVFVNFYQSPYGLLGIFIAILFIFLGIYIAKYGAYFPFEKVPGKIKEYKEDDTVVIYPDNYKELKKTKTPIKLTGGETHYSFSIKNDEIYFLRHIVPYYENVDNHEVYKGQYTEKELNDTIIKTFLPLALTLIEKGKNPLKQIRSEFDSSGYIKQKNYQKHIEINHEIMKIISKSVAETDYDKLSDEEKDLFPNIKKSYFEFSKYIKRKNHVWSPDINYIYGYIFECKKENIDILSLFNQNE